MNIFPEEICNLIVQCIADFRTWIAAQYVSKLWCAAAREDMHNKLFRFKQLQRAFAKQMPYKFCLSENILHGLCVHNGRCNDKGKVVELDDDVYYCNTLIASYYTFCDYKKITYHKPCQEIVFNIEHRILYPIECTFCLHNIRIYLKISIQHKYVLIEIIDDITNNCLFHYSYMY
jgi:hypothetical protein